MRTHVMFLTTCAAVALAGCTTGLAMKGMNGAAACPVGAVRDANQTFATLQNLHVGDSADMLEGLPVERRLALGQRDGSTLEAFLYRTGHPRCRNMPTENELTPVLVDGNGLVQGVGEVAFMEARRTATERKDLTPEKEEEPTTFVGMWKALPF